MCEHNKICLSQEYCTTCKNCQEIHFVFIYLVQTRPRKIVKYFNDATNTFGGVEDDNARKGESFFEIIKVLRIDENDLSKYNKKTSTATARHLIKLKYPNPEPNFRLANANKSIVDAIIGKFYLIYIIIDYCFY